MAREARPSRRELLVGTAAVALAPRWPAPERTFTFAFFSNTQIGAEGSLARCERALAEMAKQSPAFAIHGGDVTESGATTQLKTYRDLVAKQPFPVYHIPGERDTLTSGMGQAPFIEELKTRPFGSFDHGGCRFFLLDSTTPFAQEGHLEARQLTWLQRELKRVGRTAPIFVAIHHELGNDAVTLDNEEALLKLLAPYNVKLVMCGHGDEDRFWTFEGIACVKNHPDSWLSVVVDRQTRAVGVFRHIGAQPEPELLIAIPLATGPSQTPVYAKSPTPAATSELRWDDGPWLVTKDRLIPPGTIPGLHRLTLRRDDRNYFLGPSVPVKAQGRLIPKWSTVLESGVVSRVVEERGRILVTQIDGGVVVVDAGSGQVVWTTRVSGSCLASPVVARGMVLVASSGGHLDALNFTDGIPKWQFDAAAPIWGTPKVVGDLVIVGSGDGKVHAVDLSNGEPAWSQILGGYTTGNLATDGNLLFIGTSDGHLRALDVETGEPRWDRTFESTPDVVFGRGRLFVSGKNFVACLNSTTGDTIWSLVSLTDPFGASAPTLDGDRLYVTGTREVRSINADNGEVIWLAKFDHRIVRSSPSVAAGKLAIGCVSGVLKLLDTTDGKELAAYQMPPGFFLSSPLLLPARVFAATLGDVLMGFEVR